MSSNKFNIKKALEVILYIVEQAPIPDIYHTCKILYFADKEHLEGYGRQICADKYIAMKDGPVPSGVYNIIKFVRGDGWAEFDEEVREAFRIQGYNIIPNRKSNLDWLSKSDRKCLDHVIAEFGRRSYSDLREISHDDAYNQANRDGEISLEAIVKTLPSGNDLLDYLKL